MAQRPTTISIKDVSKAVDQAVKAASEKHKVQFGAGFRFGPGTIMGRQLLQADIPISKAEQIATEITQQVPSAGQFEASVWVGRGIIICGFWPPDPVQFGLEQSQ
ncbi:MAG TPA: hypothetical protein VMO17_22785 [Terriglobia bacterium]|nr:hypothetical protein [Terriglobia bacterium]